MIHSFAQKLIKNKRLIVFISTIIAAKMAHSLFKISKEIFYPNHYNSFELNGKKNKWAFILNSTSNIGKCISHYFAQKNYNLILGSFETEKLDEIKAKLFLEYENLSFEAYYLYKSDIKNFEEKFHFREYLKKFDVEIFVLNDSYLSYENPDLLQFNYEELQLEMSKKFLLKTFLVKIILENSSLKQSKMVKKTHYVFNLNDLNKNKLEILAFQGYEEFLKAFIDKKYGNVLNVKIYNLFNNFNEHNDPIDQNAIVVKLFG